MLKNSLQDSLFVVTELTEAELTDTLVVSETVMQFMVTEMEFSTTCVPEDVTTTWMRFWHGH